MNRPNLNGKVITAEKLTPESIQKLRDLGYVVVLTNGQKPSKIVTKMKSAPPDYGPNSKVPDKSKPTYTIVACTKPHAKED